MENEQTVEKDNEGRPEQNCMVGESSAPENVNTSQGIWWQPLQNFQVSMDM